jgi:ubiquinone/menaquinone biosynthesis C-methylase UbiE
MKHFSFGHRLPQFLAKRLFGDRRKFGLVIQQDDPCWQEWTEEVYLSFYEATQKQKQTIGRTVNDAGYRILESIDFSGKRILEIGPGSLPHWEFFKTLPAFYTLADIQQQMLDLSSEKLTKAGVPNASVLLEGNQLPFEDNEFDVILSFYSLEHLYPLQPYIEEMTRCLKPEGILAGAIPTEGGLAWGLGRFLTSRRWLQENTTINPDKLICWEHPNFAETILSCMDSQLNRQTLEYYPFRVPLIDFNLITRFIYSKKIDTDVVASNLATNRSAA